jgi:hypothetical protein
LAHSAFSSFLLLDVLMPRIVSNPIIKFNREQKRLHTVAAKVYAATAVAFTLAVMPKISGIHPFARVNTVWYYFASMEKKDMTLDRHTLVELFTARAKAVAAKVSQVPDLASAKRLIAEEKNRLGDENVGVAHAALGIAATGTCVVETDDEATRLSTMLPETSIITLDISNIVPTITDIAGYMRERQKDGRTSYTSLITGPSRTADIERVGAIGVHGPLSVHIILIEG